MKLFLAYLLAVLAVCWAIGSHLQGIEDRGRAERAQQQLNIARAQFAEALTEAEATADTVVETVTRYKTLRDSVVITDTVIQELVYQADSMAEVCLSCAARIYALDSLRTEEQRAADKFQSDLQKEIASLRRKSRLQKVLPYLAAAAGLYVGLNVPRP